MNYVSLLDKVSQLFYFREYQSYDQTPDEIIRYWVKQDLLDELTHPRLRKKKEERFFQAVKRIRQSHLFTETDLAVLLDIYIAIMAEID